MTIRPLAISDEAEWRRLWDLYLIFYETSLPDEHSRLLWTRLMDETNPIEGFAAESDRHLVGIVHFFPHPDTWEKGPACYLQDLYVDDSVRGEGIGEKLVEAVADRCRSEGWSYLYWQTAEDNAIARGLYDKLTGGRNRFVVYQMDVN
jgi:GNAT superfamily N-acetyltransferase